MLDLLKVSPELMFRLSSFMQWAISLDNYSIRILSAPRYFNSLHLKQSLYSKSSFVVCEAQVLVIGP